MKLLLICLISASVAPLSKADDRNATDAEVIVQTTNSDSKPIGPYYCQARCIAACLETFLANSLNECQKYCPPFEENVTCQTGDIQCWRTCGIPESPDNPAGPAATIFVPVPGNEDQEQDPYLIQLAWAPVANATLYIVEFNPVNWSPPAGEGNLFQALTTSLSYSVRKEDECVEYDARVIAVNSNGISIPAYAHVEVPIPSYGDGQHFSVRHMQRDVQDTDWITATIDYSFPTGWSTDDIDIDSIRVIATECKGPLTNRSFDLSQTLPDTLVPAYNVIIGKTPTAAILLSFNDDVLLSDCLFHMRIAAMSTRCNTTTVYDDDPILAPGVSFRINCTTVPDACSSDNASPIDSVIPPALSPIPVPSNVGVDPAMVVPAVAFSPPGFYPPGITGSPQDGSVSNGTKSAFPTPPPAPFAFGTDGSVPNAPSDTQPMAPESSFSVIDLSQNGSNFEAIAVNPGPMLSPMCDMEMADVLPTTSDLSPSLIDLQLTWLERQPLPPLPTPSYFTIRYGPIVRKLVDDGRQRDEIVAGYETIIRTGQTGQPDPTRQVNISSLQRNSLLKVQICAIYDQNSEPMIQWDAARSYRLDLAALEPFLEFEEVPAATNLQQPPALLPYQSIDAPPPPPQPDYGVDGGMSMAGGVPLVIQVGVDSTTSPTMNWVLVMAGVALTLLTAVLVFICLRAICNSRSVIKSGQNHAQSVVVMPPVPMQAPLVNEVKVPLS